MFTKVQHLVQSYQSYQIESNLLNYQPNNIFHFLYTYFFTDTYP